MNKPVTILSIILTAIAFSLVACDALSPPATAQLAEHQVSLSPTATEPILATPTPEVLSSTISVWHSWNDEQLPALLSQISAFQEEYPGVQFDVTYIPSIDLRLSYEQAALNGRAPDVLFGPAEWGAALYDQGFVADISSLVGDELVGSINRAAFEAARYKDAITSLPVHISGNILYRNRNIIPEASTSFDELISVAQAASHQETFGALLDRGWFYSGGHLEGIGGKLMNPDGSPAFNDEKGLAWVKLLQEFEKAGPTEYAQENDIQLFLENRLGLMIESSHRLEDLAEVIGAENLAIDPWPIYQDGTLSGFVQSENVFLNPETLEEEQMVSWKFVQSLLTPEAQANLGKVSLIPVLLPSRLAAAGVEGFIEDEPLTQVMRALSGGATYPARPEMAIYIPYLDIALQSIFNGEASPEDALKTAADSIMAELAAWSTPAP